MTLKSSVKNKISDTDSAAEKKLIELWRDTPLGVRALRVLELCEAANSFAIAGERLKNPSLSDQELQYKVLERHLGTATVNKLRVLKAKKLQNLD